MVRSMKAAGKSKEELQPMISALIDIKKKHTEMKTAYEKQATGLPLPEKESASNPDLIASLEKQVADQVGNINQLLIHVNPLIKQIISSMQLDKAYFKQLFSYLSGICA